MYWSLLKYYFTKAKTIWWQIMRLGKSQKKTSLLYKFAEGLLQWIFIMAADNMIDDLGNGLELDKLC